MYRNRSLADIRLEIGNSPNPGNRFMKRTQSEQSSIKVYEASLCRGYRQYRLISSNRPLIGQLPL